MKKWKRTLAALCLLAVLGCDDAAPAEKPKTVALDTATVYGGQSVARVGLPDLFNWLRDNSDIEIQQIISQNNGTHGATSAWVVIYKRRK